jgi:hypothetical protein
MARWPLLAREQARGVDVAQLLLDEGHAVPLPGD